MKFSLLVCFIIIFICCCAMEREKQDDVVFNAASVSPESQGMDSELLTDMFDYIATSRSGIRSMYITRNGSLVAEATVYPYTDGTEWLVHSVTKSITSLLVGIALDKGYIDDVRTPVADFYPVTFALLEDPEKQSITLEHLLMMSSGLKTEDSYLYKWKGLSRMRAHENWSEYILQLPMEFSPGNRFEYSNGVSYMITDILAITTGMTPLEFAEKHLFEPLGIEDVRWNACPRGINTGWGGMWIRPLDLLKIGHLCLNDGRWEGEQVISEEWITKATKARIDAGTLSDSYGYQWWVDREGYMMMMGLGGQYVIINPQDDIVVVITGSLSQRQFFEPEGLFNAYIRRAVVTDKPIPENPEALRALKKSIQQLKEAPEPAPAKPLPGKISEISGQQFLLTPDSYVGFTDVSFEFTPDADSFLFNISYRGATYEMNVGLDGVYRQSTNYKEISAHKGYWKDESTLVIDYEGVNYPEIGRYTFSFIHDGLIMYFEEETSGIQLTSRGSRAD